MTPGSRCFSRQRLVLIIGFFLTLLLSLLFLFQPTFLSLMGLKVYDSMVRALEKHERTVPPVIIDLDEKSLAAFGQWPWPRYRVAMLVDKLSSLGADIIALDMLFAEEDRTSLKVLREEIRRDRGVQLDFSGLPAPLLDNDLALARSLARTRAVLGYKFLFAEDEDLPPEEVLAKPLEVVVKKSEVPPGELDGLFEARRVINNLPVLGRAAAAAGFLNYQADDDGMLRRVPLIMHYEGKVYPSFALACVMEKLKLHKVFLNVHGGLLERMDVGQRRIPLDNEGRLLIHYQGRRGGFPTFSAADVLLDVVPPEELKGRVVLIGTSASGLMDIHHTPLDPHFPGVEVHATIIENILANHYLSRPAWARGLELFSIWVLGIVATFFLARSTPLTSIVVLALGGGSIWYGSFLLLEQNGLFYNPLWAVLVLGVNFASVSLFKYWLEEREVKRRTRELVLAQDTTILSLTALAETRDNETGNHIRRTQQYVRILAEYLAGHPKFRNRLDPATIELLYRSSPLHDIGKVGVSDSILLNPGKLTPEEFEQMKEHSRYGYETLVKAENRLEDDNGHSFLRLARDIAYNHHEKWDGSGYPRGLKGEEIPLAGRLMAVADVYDALISRRRYKPAFSHETAVDIIRKGRGGHFDPDVVDAFLEQEEVFLSIARQFGDDIRESGEEREGETRYS